MRKPLLASVVGSRATWRRVKLALRTSTALSQGQPIIAPPGMKRLAQTMSQPPRASATMRSSMGALTWSSAGNIRMNGAVLAAKPARTAPCTPGRGLRTNSSGRAPRGGGGGGADGGRLVALGVVVADEPGRGRRPRALERGQHRHDVAALVVDRNDDVELGRHAVSAHKCEPPSS